LTLDFVLWPWPLTKSLTAVAEPEWHPWNTRSFKYWNYISRISTFRKYLNHQKFSAKFSNVSWRVLQTLSVGAGNKGLLYVTFYICALSYITLLPGLKNGASYHCVIRLSVLQIQVQSLFSNCNFLNTNIFKQAVGPGVLQTFSTCAVKH